MNMMGRYAFEVPESVARGELRPRRDPSVDDASRSLLFHDSPKADSCDRVVTVALWAIDFSDRRFLHDGCR